MCADREPLRDLTRDVEALLFASGRPLSLEALMGCINLKYAVTSDVVERAVAELEAQYPVDGARGFELARVGQGWMFRTNRQSEPVLSGLVETGDLSRLSPAAFETLAIVAYLQPVTRRQASDIRGVISDSPFRTLLERDLIQEVGRSNEPGQPILYGTTPRFLISFGLRSLADLPALSEFEVSGRDREELMRRLGVLLAPE